MMLLGVGSRVSITNTYTRLRGLFVRQETQHWNWETVSSDTYSCRTVPVAAALPATTGVAPCELGWRQSSRTAPLTKENVDRAKTSGLITWPRSRTLRVSFRSIWQDEQTLMKPLLRIH